MSCYHSPLMLAGQSLSSKHLDLHICSPVGILATVRGCNIPGLICWYLDVDDWKERLRNDPTLCCVGRNTGTRSVNLAARCDSSDYRCFVCFIKITLPLSEVGVRIIHLNWSACQFPRSDKWDRSSMWRSANSSLAITLLQCKSMRAYCACELQFSIRIWA